MKRALVFALIFLAGCDSGNPTTDVALTSNNKTTAILKKLATYKPDKQITYQLVCLKADVEKQHFDFSKMSKYFQSVKMSKHLYSRRYQKHQFIIGMAELPDRLRFILVSHLNNDKNKPVKIGDLCTVHNLKVMAQ